MEGALGNFMLQPGDNKGNEIHVLYAVAAQVGNSASKFCCLIAASYAQERRGDWVLEFPGQHLFLVVQQNLLRKVIRTKLKYISLFNAPEFSELSSTLARLCFQ